MNSVLNFIKGFLGVDKLFQPKEGAPNSFFVYVPIPAALANQLQLEGGEMAEKLHITLAYAPNIEEIDDKAIATAIADLEYIIPDFRMLTGKVSGIGRFEPSATSNGRAVIYATPDVPGLFELRHRVMSILESARVPVSHQHDYVPHITLAYVDPSAPMPEARFDSPLSITTVCLSISGQVIELKLNTSPQWEFYTDAAGNPGRLFHRVEFAEPMEWIPYLPIPGIYRHAEYGDIEITSDRNAQFARNFNSGVYQSQLPVDAEHETKLSGAFAWIQEMRQNEDGSVDARVEWTKLGEQALEEERYKYFSPEWYVAWQNPMTGEVHENVAIGGALTTRPFFKDAALRPLVASEGIITTSEGDTSMSGDTQSQAYAEQLAKQDETIRALTEQLNKQIAASEAAGAKIEAAEAEAQKYQEQAQAMSERVAALETAQRKQRFAEMSVEWAGEGHADLLDQMALAFGEDSEIFKKHVANQNAIAEQLKMSELFTPKGSDSNQQPTYVAKMNVAVQKYMEAHPGATKEQAEAALLDQSSYDEYLEGGQ